MPEYGLVEFPTLATVSPRLMALREAARLAAERTVIGALVNDFTNDELRLMADDLLTIAEVLTLRRLGLLGPDEGFDGRRKKGDR